MTGHNRPSEAAIALFTNVFGYAPDPEALHAGECWQAERIDAALRRAKAEGVRGLIGHEQLAIQILNALERGGYLVSGPDGEEIGMTILDEVDKFLDARAAQIEEGE